MSDEHLSLDELAELDEGLLPPERISAIRAHLHGCEECQARADAITQTQSMLADLPPLTMPDDVKTRIDAALAAERPPVAEGNAAPVTDPIDPDKRSSDVIPDAVSLPRRRIGRPSAAACAAAAAIVLAVGAIIVGHAHHKSSDTADVAGADGATASGSTNPLNLDLHNDTIIVKKETGGHYNAADLSNLTPKLLGSAAVPAAATPAATSSSSKAFAQRQSSGHPDSSLAAPGTKVPRALLPLFHSQKKINACAAGLAGNPAATPAVVDFGQWTDAEGTTSPAAVFVFKTNALDTYAVYVVKANCAEDPGGAVLHYQTVAVQ